MAMRVKEAADKAVGVVSTVLETASHKVAVLTGRGGSAHGGQDLDRLAGGPGVVATTAKDDPGTQGNEGTADKLSDAC